MSTKSTSITFVLYEGKHDAAILTRLLRENGYRNFTDQKLSLFPEPLKGFLKSKIENFTYEDESRIFQKPQLPNAICMLEEENQWFVFYEMGGDSKAKEAIKLIKTISNPETDFEQEESFETQQMYSLAFFFDADSSVKDRIKTFVKSYQDALPNFCDIINDDESAHSIKSYQKTDGFSTIGLFVYGSDNGSGTLEDIVIPVMGNGNDEMFKDADNYLSKYMAQNSFNNRSKKGKALIGVVGQPIHHGKANQVILSDTKLLSKERFELNHVFTEILEFLGAESC